MNKKVWLAGLVVATLALIWFYLGSREPGATNPPTSKQERRGLASDGLPVAGKGGRTPHPNRVESQDSRKAIEELARAHELYLKEDELSRVTSAVSHEGSEFDQVYAYEVTIKSPSIEDLKKWEDHRKKLVGSLDPGLTEPATKALADSEESYRRRDSSERRITFQVPHDTTKPISYSEYSILDLKSGRDESYPMAAQLPKGIVHNLLIHSGSIGDPKSEWRYDKLLPNNPEPSPSR
jgi:hypothetical protein